MSGHRRIKDVAYDDDLDDDYYDEGYENDQGLSPEDEKQMRLGTAAVREALGPDSAVTNRQIEDALWHYYYDVGKSVSYLKNQKKPADQKKQKQPSKFDQAASAAQSKATNGQVASKSPMASCSQPLTAAEFFKDTPWLNVPAERKGVIYLEPLCPRGGLLGGSSSGGSGKPSKLAALAASRKKAQEQRRSETSEAAPTGSVTLPDKPASRKEPVTKTPSSVSESPISGTHPQKKVEIEENSSKEAIQTSSKAADRTPHQNEKLRGSPSTFARTLLGPSVAQDSSTTGKKDEFSLQFPQSSDTADKNPFLGPSPDDVVKKAQSKAPKNSKTVAKSNDTKSVETGVAALQVEEKPKPKSKAVDVESEYAKANMKNAANFVVIGHVDHGKSTLMGRLLYDLKIVNQRSVDKLRKEADNTGKSSFALAWVMDSTSEERERGVTVDIATNYFETDKTRFTILDAPGHQDFIPNMIAGAAQADFAILVIDASVNAFEAGLKGQTKEHALLVRSMGISRLIIAVNKMDTAGWSQERFIEISQQTTAFLTSAGFQRNNIAFVPCAGLTGENVATKPAADKMPWYDGPTLVEALEASEPSNRALSEPLRLTISDVSRAGPQNNPAISGRVDSGTIQSGETILAQPSGETATVKAIEVEGQPVDWCVAGQIATLHLTDIDPVHLRSGDIICSPTKSPIKNVHSFVAKVLAFDHITPGFVDVHKGRTQVAARVTQLIATLGKASGEVEKKRPRVVQPGTVSRMKIEILDGGVVPLEVGGRVVLRSEGQTIGAGLVEEVVEQKNRSS